MAFNLFLFFLKMSAVSFGGGYVLIPLMMEGIKKNQWGSIDQLTDVIALAGISPGPVAVNTATGLGYRLAGFPGMFASLVGITLPCMVIVILTAKYMSKVYDHFVVRSALYGMRPAVAGIILYAAFNIASKNGIINAQPDMIASNGYNIFAGGMQLFEVKSVILAVVSFLALNSGKVKPVWVILISAVVGIVIF